LKLFGPELRGREGEDGAGKPSSGGAGEGCRSHGERRGVAGRGAHHHLRCVDVLLEAHRVQVWRAEQSVSGLQEERSQPREVLAAGSGRDPMRHLLVEGAEYQVPEGHGIVHEVHGLL